MNDAAPAPGPRRESSAQLRHDLISPIDLILGYAYLLIDDADREGRPDRSQGLDAIRSRARRALRAIDLALIVEPGSVDPRALARELALDSEAMVESCRALEGDPSTAADRDGFLDDLARIRDAAILLATIARRAEDQ